MAAPVDWQADWVLIPSSLENDQKSSKCVESEFLTKETPSEHSLICQNDHPRDKDRQIYRYFSEKIHLFTQSADRTRTCGSLRRLLLVADDIETIFSSIEWQKKQYVSVSIKKAIDKLSIVDLLDSGVHAKMLQTIDEAEKTSDCFSILFEAWNQARNTALDAADLELQLRPIVLRGCAAITVLSVATCLCKYLPSEAKSSSEGKLPSILLYPLPLYYLVRSAWYFYNLPQAIERSNPPLLSIEEGQNAEYKEIS
jgi:hypothetical protein